VSGVAHLGESGVDEWASAVLKFPNEARHWSSTRRFPIESAQLMPGELNSVLPAWMASPAASASKE
ncbi:hypothetical protein ACC731_38460, partial [Rhizobium ruizarguesonis]